LSKLRERQCPGRANARHAVRGETELLKSRLFAIEAPLEEEGFLLVAAADLCPSALMIKSVPNIPKRPGAEKPKAKRQRGFVTISPYALEAELQAFDRPCWRSFFFSSSFAVRHPPPAGRSGRPASLSTAD